MLTIFKKITTDVEIKILKAIEFENFQNFKSWLKITYIPYIILSLSLAGCSNSFIIPDKIEQTDAQLYQSSMQVLLNDHKEAIQSLNEIEQYYPYSSLIQKAKILKLYAYYINQKFDDAELSAKSFLRYYPGSEYAAYVQYMLAMSYYMQIADPGRDQKITEEALNEFRKVILLYPGTQYATDAYGKEKFTIAMLAAQEMEIGRFYQKQGNMGAALVRFESVLANNPTTVVIPEALYRLVACYSEIGMQERATQFAALLHHNFADTEWDLAAKKLLITVNNKINNNKIKKVLPGQKVK